MKLRRMLAVTLIAALCFTAACGDDDDAGTANGGSTDGATGENRNVGGDDSELAALIEGQTERPTKITLTEPIGKPVPKGKRIVGFVCQLPACQQLAGQASDAAKALGWEYVQIPIGFTPDEITTAWEHALREDPDGILTLSTDRAFFQSGLDQAKSRGIPVVNMLVDKGPGDGVSVVLYGPDFMQRVGKEMADWVAYDSGGDASTVLVYPAQIGILAMQADAFEAEYKQVCPDCKLSRLEVPASSIGGDLTDRITGHLRANRDINYAWVGYGDMLRGLPAAMNAAGIKNVKVFSNGGDLAADASEYLRAGEHVQMFYFYAGTEVMWLGMDWFARHFAGVPTTPTEEAPGGVWIVTPETAPEGGTPHLVEDFASQYKELWGVS